MSLKITKIEIRKFEKDNLRAYVNLTFNEELTIDGYKIMNGKNGLFLASPSVKSKDGWKNFIRLSKELYQDVFDRVMEDYDKTSGSGQDLSRESSSDRESISRRRR